MCRIKNILEPEELVLTWRAPDSDSGRNRYKVAEFKKIDNEHIGFCYLKDTDDFAKAKELGFVGFPAFNKFDKVYETNVLEVFLRRTPPRKRGDFKRFLEQLGLDPEVSISDIALLAYSGAKLATDTFELINPLKVINVPAELVLEVVGTRYYLDEGVGALSIEDEVILEPEPDNQHDPNAVKVVRDKRVIGYINRFQCLGVKNAIAEYDVKAHVFKVNGTKDQPRILICVSIK